MFIKTTMLSKRSALLIPALLVLLSSCSDTDFDFEASREQAILDAQAAQPPEASFNPATGVIPFPNNLLFAGSQDNTLNIPVDADADQTLSNPTVALNQLDGFSTVAQIVTTVSEPLDADSLVLGDTVRVFEVTTPDAPIEARSAVISSVGEVTDPTAMSVLEQDNQLIILPVTPLKPSTAYMVVLTDGILDQDGEAMGASLVYRLLKGTTVLTNPDLEALRQAVQTHTAVLNGQLDIDPANVVLSWVFTTQSIRDTLQAVKDISVASSLTLATSGLSTSDASDALQGKADIFIGALSLPYYQSAVDENNSAVVAINSFWNNASGNVPGASDADGIVDFTPVQTTDVTVPVIMTVPNASSASGGVMPATGWPVSIFQHGITRNRTDMLAIADAMADAGRAVIAIDMPLHGLTDSTNPLHVSNNPLVTVERTFDIDLLVQNELTGASISGADGIIDSSGAHFYNLQNLANSRDNLRQAVADLFVLSASVASATVDGVTLDGSDLNFVGHSLGAIVGTTLVSYDNTIQSATLAMPGGGIAQLLANSASFGPVINAALAAAGLETGSAEYLQFLAAAQALVDSGDPINHASAWAESGTSRIHLIEVIDDQVIPNIVATAPLSGTDPLIRVLGLPSIAETVTDSDGAVRFTEGDHSSIVSPETSLAATVEMQTQMAGFAQSRGTVLPVVNTDVVQAVEGGNP